MDDLKGDKLRLEFLHDKVKEHKKSLKYWEKMVTRQVCIEAGQPYPERRKEIYSE